MYFSEFKKIVDENTEYPANARAIVDAADKYYISRYGQQADVMRSLPPVSEIEQALNLAQAEIRAMYKRLEIKGSNVLDKIDATLKTVQAAMPS